MDVLSWRRAWVVNWMPFSFVKRPRTEPCAVVVLIVEVSWEESSWS